MLFDFSCSRRESIDHTRLVVFKGLFILKLLCVSPLCERGFDIESVKHFFEPFSKFFLSCPRYAAQRNDSSLPLLLQYSILGETMDYTGLGNEKNSWKW